MKGTVVHDKDGEPLYLRCDDGRVLPLEAEHWDWKEDSMPHKGSKSGYKSKPGHVKKGLGGKKAR